MRHTLSIVIVSFNRAAVLAKTVRAVLSLEGIARASEVVVADNHSHDASAQTLHREFAPEIACGLLRVLVLPRNTGVDAFNTGVRACSGDLVLVLDDDAIPDSQGLAHATRFFDSHPLCAAVALHPLHARTGASEWPFARVPQDRWPIMGCGNLVRKDAWFLVQGYEPDFFLYRNDVDLALKLLAAGLDVHFDPAWIVHHDTPAGAGGGKSERWLRLATRNWLWMLRRHQGSPGDKIALLSGTLWALREAGTSPRRFIAWAQGVLSGLTMNPPVLPPACRIDCADPRFGLGLERLREVRCESRPCVRRHAPETA